MITRYVFGVDGSQYEFRCDVCGTVARGGSLRNVTEYGHAHMVHTHGRNYQRERQRLNECPIQVDRTNPPPPG